jgi:hypothetical protein
MAKFKGQLPKPCSKTDSRRVLQMMTLSHWQPTMATK